MSTALLDSMRRGACPSLSAPMLTGDGYLSRIALTSPVSPQDIINICQATLRHGSGMIDISARGNLQARGLSADSVAFFEADIRALDLPLRNGIAIDTGPLAGFDATEIADPRPLAEAIRVGAERLALADDLAPKTAVVVDGGGCLTLSELLADVRLKAYGTGWLLFTGGPEQPGAAHGLLSEDKAVTATLVLLSAMAARGRRFRGRDFTRDEVKTLTGLDSIVPDVGLPISVERPQKPFGTFSQKGGRIACGLGPAFGQIRAERLITLMRLAADAGCDKVRPVPDHALLLFAPEAASAALSRVGAGMDLICRDDDPRGSIAVCPGQPGCTSAHFETHTLAQAAAENLPALLDGSATLHISGCAKGCAHPEPADITLSGTPGRLHLTFGGKPSDPPTVSLAIERAPEALRMLSALTQSRREASESASHCLRRIGPAALRAALLQENP